MPKTQEGTLRIRKQKSKKCYQGHKESKHVYCKEHGKDYYVTNKDIMLEEAASKMPCKLCGTLLYRNWITEHTKCETLNEMNNLE